MTNHNHQTNGRAMWHDYGKAPDAREQEEEREKCTCKWGRTDLRGDYRIKVCPLHTPPEPEGA